MLHMDSAGFCEYGNEHSCSVRGGVFPDQLGTFYTSNNILIYIMEASLSKLVYSLYMIVTCFH
jgi:hypothetical protein